MKIIKKISIAMLFISMALPALAQERKQGVSKIRITAASKFNNTKLTIYQEWPVRKLIDTLHLKEGDQELHIIDSLPAVYSLSIRKPYASTNILLDGGTTSVAFNDGETKVSGGKLEMKLQQHQATLAPLEKEWQGLGNQYIKETDMEKKIILEKKTYIVANSVSKERLRFVQENSTNTAGAWMAQSYAYAWTAEALKILSPLFQKQQWAKATYQQLSAKLEAFNAVQMTGKKAPEFTLTSMQGISVSLDSILKKNEYVLIDVWASWCTPCRVTNRKLAPEYAELKKKGIEFVSISVDEDPAAWKKAVLADKIPWMQLLSDKAMKGNFAAAYQVQTLPSTFLVNKQGVIIKQHVEIADLKKL